MTPKFHLTHPVLNPAGTVLQVTPRISANLSWTNVPRKNPQNLKFQVAPRIINVEYHTAGNHTQPLMSTKPSAMTKKTAFQQQKQLCFSSRVYAMSTSGFRDKNRQTNIKNFGICGWKPVSWSSPWVAAAWFGKNMQKYGWKQVTPVFNNSYVETSTLHETLSFTFNKFCPQ